MSLHKFQSENDSDFLIQSTVMSLRRAFDDGAAAMKQRCIEAVEQGFSYAHKNPNTPAPQMLEGAIKRLKIAGTGCDLRGRP